MKKARLGARRGLKSRRAKLAAGGVLVIVLTLLLLTLRPASAATWHARHSPTPKTLSAIHFPTPLVGYVVGSGGFNTETALLKTTDGGFSWQQLSTTPPPNGNFAADLKSVFFLTDEVGFVAQSNGGNAIWKTIDGGKTWTLVHQTEQSGSRPINGLVFGSPTKGVAVGEIQGPPFIAATSDGGDTWQSRTVPSGTGPLSAVRMEGDRAIAVGQTSGNATTAAGRVLYSTNGGETWAASASTIPFLLKGVSIAPGSSGLTAYAVGTNGLIVKTTDGGVTWSAQASGTGSALNGVAFINTSVGHAVGASSTFLETTDGGRTWVPNTGPDTQTTVLNAVAFADSANRYSVGSGGKIFRYHSNDVERSSVVVSDVTVVEGDEGTTELVFPVSLSSAAAGTASVDWETTEEGSASGQDYTAASGSVTFGPGETAKTTTVTLFGNVFPEPTRTVVVRLKNPQNMTINKGRAVGTITDNDTPSIRVNDATVAEGTDGATTATFVVGLPAPAQVEVTVDFTTVDGTATAGQDYQAASGTLSFPAGVTTTVVDVSVFGDTEPEQDEIFYIDLSNAVPAAVPIARARASGVISNDDVLAFISVADPDPGRIDEPDEGQTAQAVFTVSLEEPTSGTVTVDYATSDGTATEGATEPLATAGVDYQAVTGTAAFPPGVTSTAVSVTIIGDDEVEDHEAFSLDLSNRSLNSNIVNASATAVIHDEDSVPDRMTLAAARAGGGVGVVDPEMGLMYVGNKVIDLETRKEIGTLGHSASIQAIDLQNHRLFLIGSQVAVYRAVAERTMPVFVTSFAYPAGLTPQGATFYRGPGEERLYFLTHTEGGGNFNPDTYTTLLHQVNVTRLLNPGTIPFNPSDPNDYWTYHVAQCSRPLDSFLGRVNAAVARGSTYVSLACSPGFVFPSQTPGQQGVARVSLGPLGVPTHTEFFPLPGQTWRGNGIADQGSGRIFVMTNNGSSGDNPVVWGFDPIRAAYVGSLSMPSRVLTMAIDQRSGNIFVVSEGSGAGGGPWSVRISDARAPALWPGVLETVQGNLQITDEADHGAYDWVRRQLILPWGQGGQIYFKDALPDLVPPPDDELDPSYLVAEEEVEGLTAREYVGGTQAYGVKYRFVGGLGNAAVGQFQLGTTFTNQGFSGQTREVTLAAVPTTALSNGEASARAIGADADANTKKETSSSDYWKTRLCGANSNFSNSEFCSPSASPPPPLPTEFLWSEAPATCRDKGESDEPEEVISDDGRERVFCHKSDDEVWGGAAYTGGFLEGAPVSAGTARVFTTSYLDEARGMVSRSVAEVKGVRIGGPEFGGQVIIGTIRSVAESWATGRGETEEGLYGAGGKFERAFTDVWVTQDGQESRVCGSSCDNKAVADALNVVLGSRMRITMPDPDPRWLAGTPKGYRGEVSLNELDQLQFQVFSEDPSGRLEVPALVVTLSNDEAKASRHVFWLAGVMAESKFGITCLYGPNVDLTACNLPPTVGPASLKLTLTDDSEEPKPLAGGVFEVYSDLDDDGVLGLTDELLTLSGGDEAVCTTSEDGIGDCALEGIVPGTYLIHQSAAPEGYAPAEDLSILMEPDASYEVTFKNVRAVGGVRITLTDDSESPVPLAGGVFSLYQDDGDGKLGTSDKLYAVCTSSEKGECQLQPAPDATVTATSTALTLPTLCIDVAEGGPLCGSEVPSGAYLVEQSAAPSGYLPDREVRGFALLPGAFAAFDAINGREGVEATPGTPGTPAQEEVVVIPGATVAPRVTTVAPPPAESPQDFGRGPLAIAQRLFDGLKFIFSDPGQAIRAAALWLFLAAPLILAARRRWLPKTNYQK